MTLQNEKPELEVRKTELLKQEEDLKIQLAKLEESLLEVSTDALPHNSLAAAADDDDDDDAVVTHFFVVVVTIIIISCDFYSASALLAMQSAVLASGILSVCLSVRPSVTFRYCVQTNEDTIVQFSASGRTIPLVSVEVKFIRILAGDHPQRGLSLIHI